MKIPANSFGLDMNAMLNEMNGQRIHGYYNKMIVNNSRNIQKIRNRFNYQIQHNRNDSRVLGKELADEINKNRANDEAMWNHAIPKQIRNAMDETLNQVPSSTVYYYPPGQHPSDPSPGDVVWHIPDPSEFGSNNIKASAERYYKNGGWHEIKGANQDVFGADIMGANIKGGEITGAEFRSNEQANRQHAAFSVNAEGRVYAQNFTADLAHEVRGEQLNPINYNGYVDSGEGFNLANGILGMTATADQMGGKFIWSDHPNMKGNTLLEPGYLKLRYFRDNKSNFVRTDLRAGVLQIAGNTWDQDAGIRLGYWNTTGPHITLGDWDSIEDGNGNLHISNLQNMREINLHSPLNLVHGDLLLNGDVKLKGESNENLRDRLKGHENTLNSHGVKIGNHGEILDGNDESDTNNMVNGRNNPNSHENQLRRHQQWMYEHDDEFNKRGQKLKKFADDLKNKGDILDSQGDLIGADGRRLDHHKYRLDSHGNILNDHGNKLSSHATKLLEHDSDLADHANQLQNHEGQINGISDELGNIFSATPGKGGDVTFKDLTSGHFTFWNDISVLGGSSISVGGDGATRSTQLWDSHMFSNTIQTGTIMLGPNQGYELTTTDYGGLLMYDNKPIATRAYVDNNHHDGGVSKSTVQSMIDSSGVSTSTVQSMISSALASVGDGSGIATHDWVHNSIRKHTHSHGL